MNLTRLLRMSPAEIGTRTQQAMAKRWGSPPACRLGPGVAGRRLPELPAPASHDAAEKICRGRFDLLGYRDLDFGLPIDWHFDPVHNKRAPRGRWNEIPFLDFARVGDHKVIWELNRHQHFVTLAQAWEATGEERFRAEMIAQWTHWQSENPYPFGINWASTLEVAFRALSWLWVRQIMGEFHADLLPALHLHGWYIEQFLSTYFSPNTHLLGEGAALFAIGLLCPRIAEAERWQQIGWNIVLRQAETQVRPDGFHFEQSTYYHGYARDFFQFTRDVAACNGIAVPAAFEKTIGKMNEACAVLSQAGCAPSFGDDDGGHVIVAPGPGGTARQGSVALPAAGIYAMSSGNAQLFIDAGPQGAFSGGHGHADALSVQLVHGGKRLLIDPGTFCYVCPERDRFRGTGAHNTVQIDGRDQATPNGPFGWTNMPDTVVERWETGETFDYFAGHHNGYAPVIHHRYVFGLKPRFWVVRDVVVGTARHRLDIHWHILDEKDLTVVAPAGHNWTRTVERWDWSPVYGREDPAWVLRYSTEAVLPAELAVVLTMETPGTLRHTGSGEYEYQDAGGTHEFRFGERFVYRGGGMEFSV